MPGSRQTGMWKRRGQHPPGRENAIIFVMLTFCFSIMAKMAGVHVVFLRCLVAGLVGLLVGAGSGFGISFVFIITPLQKILGPRYSEFDFFGVIGVTIFAALIAFIGATISAARSKQNLAATFRPRNLLAWVLAPLAATVVLTFAVDREWVWFGLIHLASCCGIFAGAGAAMFFYPHENAKLK